MYSYVRYSRILTVPTVCMIMTEGTSSVIQENFMLRKHLMLLITINISKDNKTEVVIARNEHFTEERLVQCKYFEVYKYDVNDEAKITVDEASFVSVLFINGSGTIETDDYEKTMEFKAGDSFFVSAGLRSIIIKGQATMVVTRV